MRRISKGVEQGRGLQKVHLAFENILLCDAQVQPVPQKLLLVMAMVLHGPKAPPNTGLPEHIFLEFLWEAKSRFWKKKSYSSSVSLQGETMLQPNVPIPVLAVCFFLCGSSKMNFPLILLVSGMFPAHKGTVPQGLGCLHHTPKGDSAQVLTKRVLPL